MNAMRTAPIELERPETREDIEPDVRGSSSSGTTRST